MQGRVAASGRNFRAAFFGQVLIFTVNMLSRRLFMRALGGELLGFSGLCGHLLNLLCILEPGLDAACIYALYRPLSENDTDTVCRICNYLKRAYRIVALLSLTVGLALLPVAERLSGNEVDINATRIIWVLSVFCSSLSYLFSHKRILPFADMRGYALTINGYIFFIICQAVKIAVLLYVDTEPLLRTVVYLAIGPVLSVAEDACLSFVTDRMYPYLKHCSKDLSASEHLQIKKGTRALFLSRLCGIICGSADNMSIFIFLGLSEGAAYSNYTLLTGTCLSFVGILTGAACAGIGNLGATSSIERMKRVYEACFFAVLVLSCAVAVALYFTFPSIISLWMGDGMVLGRTETALFCFNLLIHALRRPTSAFLDALGLFEKERGKSVLEATVCLALTLILTPHIGICGVLIGQGTGSVISFFIEPMLLYKYGFREKCSDFPKMLFSVSKALPVSLALCFILLKKSSLTSALETLSITSSLASVFSPRPLTVIIGISCFLLTSAVFLTLNLGRQSMLDALKYGVRMIFRDKSGRGM